ncbi:transmembrane protein 266 [Pristis pectinata]|uniref:transmembrane protein 266 n=1 Tax=Pristis pectinata TaxID=685728 RepID=UPI00223DA617|nr:transmembrane protein 266 [Pristis pectinata]XP_051898730.1 transmembrane protein 266 [Pristis pectinata]XP_051898732.1 transmembrane protein 266 [Pristis pectinata]
MADNQLSQEGGVPDLEIISQQVEEESQCIAPVQLVSFAYRDLPLATLDLSLAGSQLLSNMDDDDQRESSNWLKPCCGRRAAVWQVVLLSVGLNCFLVAAVVLVVLLLTLELLIDTKLLQFTSAFQFAGVIHWISLVILSVFFTETVFRIVVLGIWDYIENKVEVFDGAVIVLSLAPMVASTVANGPSSPWDAISLIITLRIWKVKRIIDAYVLPVKVEMEMVVQQYEKAKQVREEQLERLTQICQEQAFEIRQLRAHLAQQDLDLAAEREAAMQMHHVWNKQTNKFQVVDGSNAGASDDECPESIIGPHQPPKAATRDDMNNYISQYYSEPSSEMAVPEGGSHVITTAAIDVHLPSTLHNASSDLLSVEVPHSWSVSAVSVSDTSGSASRSIDSSTTQAQSVSSQTLGSSTDCSTTREISSESYLLERPKTQQQDNMEPMAQNEPSRAVQQLLSTLSEDTCLTQKGLDPVNLKPPSPPVSPDASPELGHRVNLCNKKNQDHLCVYPTKPVIQIQGNDLALDEKYRLLESTEPTANRLPES